MKYSIGALVTISMYTEVEADSEQQARDRAMEHDMPTLCHQCAGGDPTEQWCTSGEYDGTPQISTVDAA